MRYLSYCLDNIRCPKQHFHCTQNSGCEIWRQIFNRPLPRHFECSEETNTPQHGHAQWRHNLLVHQNKLQNRTDNHDEVKSEKNFGMKFSKLHFNIYLLKRDTMQPDNPRAYIFNNISKVKRQTKNKFVYSQKIKFYRGKFFLDNNLSLLGSHPAILVGCGVQLREHRCSETQESQSTKTSTEIYRFSALYGAWCGSI